MILVKIESYRGSVIEGGEVLASVHLLANTIGGALNSRAPSPAQGAVFVVSVLDTDVDDPVYDK